MNKSPMPWVKLYTEMLDDPKIGRVPEAIKWRFVQLILVAGECDSDGCLMSGDKPLTLDEIAWRLRMDAAQLQADLEQLKSLGVVSECDGAICVANFAKRQGRSQGEKRAQWRESKQRKKAPPEPPKESNNELKTFQLESCWNPTHREEKRREEKRESTRNVAKAPPSPTDVAAAVASPAVRIHFEIMGVNLAHEQCLLIHDKVKDLNHWRDVLTGWKSNPRWKKDNVLDQLDRYTNTLPFRAETKTEEPVLIDGWRFIPQEFRSRGDG